METLFHRFISEEKGSVTADWATLAAGATMLVLAVIGTVSEKPAQIAANSHTTGEVSAPLL